jgi:hypothetical protein
MGSVPALSAEAYTTTFCLMVVKGGGRAPPPLTSLGLFFHHVGIDSSKSGRCNSVLCDFDGDEINCSCAVQVGQTPI